ncbi:MAG: hypothetical protein K0S74_776 [Chlamydiales bacterium]|jgi:proline iminopeptidase|nr:hypothetical protein [Chlamydiales bacterium]
MNLSKRSFIKETFVCSQGRGKRVITVHGGPGLNHQYLKYGLIPLESEYCLVYYDQLGCGESLINISDINIKNCCLQLKEVIENFSFENPIILLAHSWGCLLVLETLKQWPHLNIGTCVFISPMPFSKREWDRCQNLFWNKLSDNIKQDIAEINSSNIKDKDFLLFNKILPFYVHAALDVRQLHINEYNGAVQESLIRQLGDYKYTESQLKAVLPSKTIVFYGDKDFVWQDIKVPQYIQEKSIFLHNVGHFPFYESPKKFKLCLESSLDRA